MRSENNTTLKMLRLHWATSFFLAALLLSVSPNRGEARSYSSGGGRSYSSSSSRSSGSSSSRSSSGGGSRSSSGGSSSSSRSFSSSKGKSYSSGSTSSDENRHSYSASKSYTSGSGHTFSSGTKTRAEARSKEPESHSGSAASRQDARSTTSASDFAFDRNAARARKEEASRQEFARFKNASLPKPPGSEIPGPPLATPRPSLGGGSYRRPVYIPDAETIWTRPARARTIFYPYVERPVVVYRDPYSSFFWWWLLDRTLDDRAAWAYHHRYDMDPARYQALVSENHDLEQRVAQLERNQVPRDPSYTPAGIDRDLMYSDKQVARVYHNRPTTSGRVLFWLVAIPLAAGAGYFLVWLVFFKRWQAPRRAAAAT